jgi:LCP family protein required for cell wall assembly
MSQFKTKKLNHTTTSTIQNPVVANITTTDPKRKIRRIIAGFLIVLALVFGVNYAVQGIGNIRVGTAWDGTSWVPPIFQSSGVVAPVGQWVTNILIAGIGGRDHDGGSLTDSIMLASFDEDHRSVTMISIPRDLYVSYGKWAWAGKINTLYPIGLGQKEGISLLASKVSEITGQSIQHYMVIDFTAFRYVVNALDGIDVDVEKNLYDNEYPDYNYGYTVFSVKQWLQKFDGETALRYARSRHSTSDIDRSHRQQQIINAIKTKALSAGIITSPTKVSNIIDATRKNIDTDMTVSDIVSLGVSFASIEKSAIHVYNLGIDCLSYSVCSVGSYLYNPSMAYFGGAWSIIPEWARINNLSYYDRIHRFVDFVFRFPGIHTVIQPIVVVHTATSLAYSKNLLMEMRKIGINYDTSHALKASTGSIDHSHINMYWNSKYHIGIDPESTIVAALKTLDMRIPVNIVTSNEYVMDDGPKIEIVLGADYKQYFTFAYPVSYLPKIEIPSASGTTVSWEKNKTPIQPTKTNQTQSSGSEITPKKNTSPIPTLPNPGEWENL